MHKRKLLIGLATAGLLLAGFGAATMPASAEQRTLLVTLLGGAQVTVTVDVPPGTPVDQIKIPGVTAPIVAVQDITPQQPQPQQQQSAAPVQVQVKPPGQKSSKQSKQPSKSDSGSAAKSGSDSAPATKTKAPKDTSATAGSPDKPTEEPKAGQQVQQVTSGKAGKAQAPVEAAKKKVKDTADKVEQTTGLRKPDGVPTTANPTLSEALPGPAPIGVPNFFIDKFRIPPFLLPIYQAAGIEYGVRWEVLAAINEIETDYGRNLNVSTAGAVGWMQFLPSTWKRWGVDANHDGKKDPYNPVDAIFGAARYLKAARADQDVRQAIFAYNHADWYVDSVLMRARLIGGLPADLVGSLTGLTQGHFPVYAKARYADDISERDVHKRIKHGNAAVPVTSSSTRRGINIFAKPGSPVIAVQDGKIIRMGWTKRLGKFIQLRDVYGNTYTYAHLKKLALAYPVPKEKTVSKAQVNKELHLTKPKKDPKPTAPASAGKQVTTKPAATAAPTATAAATSAAQAAAPDVAKERVFANPGRPSAYKAGGEEQLLNAGSVIPGYTTFKSYFTGVYGLKRSDVVLKKLKPGSKVIAGTILGRIGRTEQKMAPHMLFEIRPAGRGAPRIDPKPILDGWKLLESTAIYRAAGKNPFWGPDSKNPSIGQILLMSKEALQHRVLTDPGIQIYDCGRRDIKAGGIDRRVLATLEFLSASGLKPTVTALHCGHSYLTTSGNVSEHSSGNAVDIAQINGIPILGHQGPGSITDITIRRLLTLQGAMKPHQIISLMTFDGADNTLALPDHNDHIHVGFQPLFGEGKLGSQLNGALKPGQWTRLMKRLGEIENPAVPIGPSKYAIKVPKRASKAHVGE
ncbi:MAG TPA: peptidoglycan DD-metalloendopeptidase family protein [Solirubrobacteraceae bacterium]|jgi:murein DD-endopeptidase MepM/ murein hydrolase activator NlpD